MKISCYAILLIGNLSLLPVFGQKFCRGGRDTHLNVLWQDQFPGQTTDANKAVCDGTVTVKADGQICIDGRMTYGQLVEELGNDPPIYQPAVSSISVTGHLTAGSGNAVLGSKAKYIYDFVTSYKINNESFDADETIVDKMLTASRGTIDGVCFDPSFRANEESWYDITHDFFFLGGINYDVIESKLDTIGLWFFSSLGSVVEYHTPVEPPGFFRFSWLTSGVVSVVNFIVGAFPSFLYGVLPVFAITGVSRLIVTGAVSTKQFPNPFTAPDTLGAVEGVQVDAKWDTLVAAVKDGMFTTEKVPLYFNVVIKRIEASGTNYKCWGEGVTMAAIDLEAPSGQGPQLDDFIENVVYPKLSQFGDVAIHFGKRSPPNSSILKSALDFYDTCGVEIGLDINSNECYHPICKRETTPTEFQYPAAYYTS